MPKLKKLIKDLKMKNPISFIKKCLDLKIRNKRLFCVGGLEQSDKESFLHFCLSMEDKK